jgi:hypothetical protein
MISRPRHEQEGEFGWSAFAAWMTKEEDRTRSASHHSQNFATIASEQVHPEEHEMPCCTQDALSVTLWRRQVFCPVL